MRSQVFSYFLAFSACVSKTVIGAAQDMNQPKSSREFCEKDKVYHNSTRTCYYPSHSPPTYTLPNATSPCGQLQYFYAASEHYGVCDCITDDGCRFPVDFHRPVVNWPGSNRCYYAYEKVGQGPCKPGEWIVLNSKTFQSECRPNPCRNLTLQEPLKDISSYPYDPADVFWFVKNNTCYQTFTRAYCKEDEYVRFVRTEPTPYCVKKVYGFGCGGVSSTAMLPCSQGHKRVGDECIPAADID